MRVVVQRVSSASVFINKSKKRQIGKGLVLLLGIEDADTDEDIEWLIGKISRLRIFDDEGGVMNLSIKDIKGDILLISQFTLFASTRKGNRPSYTRASRPEVAIPLYEHFVEALRNEMDSAIETGEFGAHMDVTLTNDGPVTIIIDSHNKE
ncbi:MAG: D-aminoacyl-tRNA deacylase [Bacteroidales bacterium]